MSQKAHDPNEKEELVITPGGVRPKNHVHVVGAGEAVYIDKKGEASVGPRQALLSKARERGTKMGEDFVLTPGGYRHRSLVHRVEPGHAVQVTGDHVRMMNQSTRAFIDIPEVTVQAAELPVLGSGWIATSYWNNGTGSPIKCFRSTWLVPPEPATRSNQLIYLFNGISRFSGNSAILQPVLQWGTSPDGGGQFWAVASWYVHTTGQAFYTPLVRVNVGDSLIGVMTLTGQSGNSFNYNCQFEGLGGTSLPVLNIEELLWCSETLEAYGIKQCSDYPATPFTAFQAINLQTGSINPPLNWAVEDRVTDCGQHTRVVSSSATNGQVDIYYRTNGASGTDRPSL